MPYWYQNVRTGILLVQSIAGMLVFWYSLKKRSGFQKRLVLSTLLGCMLCIAAQALLYVPGDAPGAWLGRQSVTVVHMAALVGIAYFCFDESIFTVIMAACTGSVTQDMGGTVKQIAKLSRTIDALCLNDFGVLLIDVLCYGGVFVLLYGAFKPYTAHYSDDERDRKVKIIVSVFAILFRMTLVRFLRDEIMTSTRIMLIMSAYQMLVGVMLLMLQFGVLESHKLSRQVGVMRELMHQQYAQYEESKTAVELIHEKYHDLKQIMTTLQGIVPDQQLGHLKESIERFESRVRSGNDVLDVLLTQKIDQCIQQDIHMTINLGGTDFSFMEEMDLYTLFHNALNNAIHAVSDLPEGVFRYILLLAQQEGGMVTIHLENPCVEKLHFEDGLPRTRSDPRYHGFGMKSMERTAEKYEGTLAVLTENGRFYLDILLVCPICEENPPDTMGK